MTWFARPGGRASFHDGPRLSATHVRGHHRILVIRLVDSPHAGLDQIGAQNQTEYRLALGGAPSGDLSRRSDG